MKEIKNIKELKVGDIIITFVNGITHFCEVIAFSKHDTDVVYITDDHGHAHELHNACLEDGSEKWFKDYTSVSILRYKWSYYSKMMLACERKLHNIRNINNLKTSK